MSNRKLTIEERISIINQYIQDNDLDIDIIYYQIWNDKCVCSSTLYISDTTMANDLKSFGITIEAYVNYSADHKKEISIKIFNQHQQAESSIISALGATSIDMTTPYQIRYHTGKVNVQKVYDIMLKSTKNK